jgi:hypothetical protein
VPTNTETDPLEKSTKLPWVTPELHPLDIEETFGAQAFGLPEGPTFQGGASLSE